MVGRGKRFLGKHFLMMRMEMLIRGSRVRTGRHSFQVKHTVGKRRKERERRSRCNIPTHSGCVVKDPHAISLYEGFPAQLDVGYVAEAGQQTFANQHVAMPRVVPVPVLVQSQYDRYMAAVHCTPSVHF